MVRAYFYNPYWIRTQLSYLIECAENINKTSEDHENHSEFLLNPVLNWVEMDAKTSQY